MAKCGVEVATIVGQSDDFQCFESTALAVHLEVCLEDSPVFGTHRKTQVHS